MSTFFYKGRRVWIRELTLDDVFVLYRWLSKGLYFYKPAFYGCSSVSRLREKLRVVLESEDLTGLVARSSDSKPIGVLSLAGDRVNERAELSFFFERLGKPALEAISVSLKYVFEDLGFYKIFFHVLSGNKPMLSILRKLGLRKEGLLVEEIKLGGKREDVLRFSLLKKEYESKPIFRRLRSLVEENPSANL